MTSTLVTQQEVFDLLVGAYKADANVQDYAGKKPRQYLMVQCAEELSLSLSSDTFMTLKDRRKHRTSKMEKNPGILRFGSLSAKVKKQHRRLIISSMEMEN